MIAAERLKSLLCSNLISNLNTNKIRRQAEKREKETW